MEGVVMVFEGVGKQFTQRSIILPNLNEGEVLVKISMSSICGSDLHTITGTRCEPTPSVLGHEGIGSIVRSNRLGYHEGQRVTWSIANSCSSCVFCTTFELPQKCDKLFKYGHSLVSEGSGFNGCYATHILLKNGTHIVPIPENLSDQVVVSANCALATMVASINRIKLAIHAGNHHIHDQIKSAWIQGSGMLGLYGCALLKEEGVDQVYCSSTNSELLKLVPLFGGIPILAKEDDSAVQEIIAHFNSSPLKHRRGVDIVIEVAGKSSNDLFQQGIKALRPGGFFSFVGMVTPSSEIHMTGEQVIRKCVTIQGVHNYSGKDLDESVSFLHKTAMKYPYHLLVSEPFPLCKIDEAIHAAQSHRWPRVILNNQ